MKVTRGAVSAFCNFIFITPMFVNLITLKLVSGWLLSDCGGHAICPHEGGPYLN